MELSEILRAGHKPPDLRTEMSSDFSHKPKNLFLRLIVYVFCFVCIFAITGCAKTPESPTEVPLFEFCGITQFADNFETDFPISVSVVHNTIESGTPIIVNSETTIRAVFEALRGITVGGENGSAHTDDHLQYWFTMQDGSRLGFSFQQGQLMRGNSLYKITGFGKLTSALSYQTIENRKTIDENSYTIGDVPAGESLLDWIKSGQFSYCFDMEIRSAEEEIVLQGSGGVAANKGDFVIYYSDDDTSYRLVYKDGIHYVVDDGKKLCAEVSGESLDQYIIPGLITDWAQVALLDSGEEIIDEISLIFEHCTIAGTESLIFLNNGQVCAIDTTYEEYSIRLFVYFASNRSDGAAGALPGISFDLPENYAQSMEEHMQQSLALVSPVVFPGSVLDENFSHSNSLLFDCDRPFKEVVNWYKDLWPSLGIENGNVHVDKKDYYSYDFRYMDRALAVTIRDMSSGRQKKCDISIIFRD